MYLCNQQIPIWIEGKPPHRASRSRGWALGRWSTIGALGTKSRDENKIPKIQDTNTIVENKSTIDLCSPILALTKINESDIISGSLRSWQNVFKVVHSISPSL